MTEVLPPRYDSVRLLAHGGMGEIYLATDATLGREVAVKVLAEQFALDEGFRARFTREALAAARVSSEPNTVTIYDVGEWNGRPYIVMEYAPGGTVADRMATGTVSPSTALRWIDQAAHALDTAHAHGVVHRDVKPANLLLAGDETVRVADFGIASAAGLTALTAAGTVLGTLGYLAPEQAAGGQAGPEADRYSLAVVAYQLLAGRRPFQSDNGPTAEAMAASREPVPLISSEQAGLPPRLDPVFEHALARSPSQRYPSSGQFARDLRRAFERTAAAAHVPPVYPPPRRWRLSRGPLTLLVLIILLALAAGGVLAALLVPDSSQKAAGSTRPVVMTVTERGRTVTVTTPAAPETVHSPASGAALNDAGFRRMQAGDYRGALPLLEQAVQKLSGSRSTTFAYALYNLARTRFELGRCDSVLALLDESERIQGYRAEIATLRREASTRCG
jgi:hypothetical protein